MSQAQTQTPDFDVSELSLASPKIQAFFYGSTDAAPPIEELKYTLDHPLAHSFIHDINEKVQEISELAETIDLKNSADFNAIPAICNRILLVMSEAVEANKALSSEQYAQILHEFKHLNSKLDSILLLREIK